MRLTTITVVAVALVVVSCCLEDVKGQGQCWAAVGQCFNSLSKLGGGGGGGGFKRRLGGFFKQFSSVDSTCRIYQEVSDCIAGYTRNCPRTSGNGSPLKNRYLLIKRGADLLCRNRHFFAPQQLCMESNVTSNAGMKTCENKMPDDQTRSDTTLSCEILTGVISCATTDSMKVCPGMEGPHTEVMMRALLGEALIGNEMTASMQECLKADIEAAQREYEESTDAPTVSTSPSMSGAPTVSAAKISALLTSVVTITLGVSL